MNFALLAKSIPASHIQLGGEGEGRQLTPLRNGRLRSDVDGDRMVTARDVALLAEFIRGRTDLELQQNEGAVSDSGDRQPMMLDVTGDNVVDALDLQAAVNDLHSALSLSGQASGEYARGVDDVLTPLGIELDRRRKSEDQS